MAGFAGGTTCEELRRQFERITGRRRQTFYDTWKYIKHKDWVIGGGGHSKLYQLNPDGCWKPSPQTSAGEILEKDRLEHLVESQTQQIGELQGEVERLLDWRNGNTNGDTNGGNIALSSLIRIVGDSAASTRQRIKAAAAILGYKVQDDGVVEFTKRFLQSVCESSDIAIDYKIEASELLRRHEAPRIASESVRPAYSDSGGTEAGRTEAWRTYQRWQLRKQIVLETRNPPQPGWDDHLQADTYVAPEGNSMPPVRVVSDPTSGFRLLDNLMPGFAGTRRNGSGVG
jgi:hypothetical protein